MSRLAVQFTGMMANRYDSETEGGGERVADWHDC